MADVFRRLILKVPEPTPGQLSRLSDALAEALNVQNRLAAQSPYILRFTGPLQEDEGAFFVEHEPATAWTPRDLFDANVPTASPEQLLQVARALIDALVTAHASGGARPVVHGGLCPGVILTGTDGLFKVTDFGFAPAICNVLDVDSYLNLAVGPQADASGAWEVLAADVVDRDDRLCAFIDPDKYGQGTLASFEPGSDIIAAGLIFRLLAEHKHPYLSYEPEAHRAVAMAEFMSFGVPIPFRRKDLCESENPDIQLWRELVTAMLARLPSERPSANELSQQFAAVAVPELNRDVLKAERWVQQLEDLLDTESFPQLELALNDRPELAEWPADLRAHAEDVEARARKALAEEAQRAAVETEHRTARQWFDRLQSAVKAEEWDTAKDLLIGKPRLDHWPQSVLEQLEPLAARIGQAHAEQKARAWHTALREAFESPDKDWPAVGTLLEQRPERGHCSEDMLAYASSVQATYDKQLEEDARKQRQIASQQSEVRGWLQRAKHLADSGHLAEAIDLLDKPPQVEHWPADGRKEAEELSKEYRRQLAESIDAKLRHVAESARRQGEAIVHGVIAQRLSGLVRVDGIETRADDAVLAPPDTDADARASLSVRLRTPSGRAAPEPVRGELDLRLKEDEAQVCRGGDELGQRIGDMLSQQLLDLQKTRLRTFERDLRKSVFPETTVRAGLDRAQPQVSAEIQLLGQGKAEGAMAIDLRWNDSRFSWAPADSNAFVARALAVATAVTQRVVLTDLIARSQALRAYEGILSVALSVSAGLASDEFPKSLSFGARLSIDPANRGDPQPLCTGTAVCKQVGRASFDAGVQEIESKLDRLIIGIQDESRRTLAAELKQLARAAPTRTRIVAPKRVKTPANQAVFKVRPKTRDPLVLTATWNTATLAYELPAKWKEEVEALLGQKPAPTPAAKTQPTRKTGTGRRGVIAATAVAAVVGLASVGVYLSFSGGTRASPGTTPPPPEPPPGSTDRPSTDSETSLVTAAEGTAAADATETDSITVALRDAHGNPVPGHDVTLTAVGDPPGVVIGPPSGPSDENGVVTFEVSSTQAYPLPGVHFQATDRTEDPGVVIPQQATIVFAAAAADPDASTVTAADGTAAADDVETELVTVVLRDAAHNPVHGHEVSLEVSGGEAAGVTIGAPSGPSDESGVVTFTVSSAEPKTVAFQATDATSTPNVVVAQTAAVTFVPGAPGDLVQSLRDVWQSRGLDLSDPQGLPLDKLFGELIQEGGEAQSHVDSLASVAHPGAAVRDWDIDGQRLSFKVAITLKAGAGQLHETFLIQRAEQGDWLPDPGNVDSLGRLTEAARTKLQEVIATARGQVEANRARGNLRGVYEQFDGVNEVLLPMAGEENVLRLGELMSTVPPRWREKQRELAAVGYRPEGRWDDDIEYPPRLADREGNLLVRVSVAPGDELWSHLKDLGELIKASDPLHEAVNDESERPWRIFYIDADEARANTFTLAREVADNRGRELPTRDEWFLAALKLRTEDTAKDLFGGLLEWCDGPPAPADGEHWLCGGSRLLLERKPQTLPRPAPGAALADWWRWLTHPFVMQARPAQFGDQLTGVRTVLPIYPRD